MVLLKLKEVSAIQSQRIRWTKMAKVCSDVKIEVHIHKSIYMFNFTNYAEKGVPDFWLTAMKNNEVLAEEVCCS